MQHGLKIHQIAPENKDKYFKNCNGLDQCKNGTLTSIKSRSAVGDTSHSNVKYSSDALAAAAEPDSVLGQCYRPTNKYIGPEPSCWVELILEILVLLIHKIHLLLDSICFYLIFKIINN